MNKQYSKIQPKSFKRQFSASLRSLTFLYAGILAIILIISCLITYSSFSNRVARHFDGTPPQPEYSQREDISDLHPTQEQLEQDLIISLAIVNGFLLILAGMASYWLAKITLQPVQEAYQQQQRFLGDASHELRTPLSILQMDLENELADKNISDKARERTQSNLEEVQRMGKLVSDLLILSRSDEHDGERSPISPEKIHLPDLVRSIIKRLQPLANPRTIILSVNSASPDITVVSHSDLLAHAITNVINNAILYNKPGGSVIISITEEKSFACVTVTDTGAGISKEDLQNIFSRFYRSDKSRSRTTGGSGLGLSIVQSAIENLNGTVNIESELGKGTTVTICVPKK